MKAIATDDLIALNDEIRALVRAGVPLEHGLWLYGNELPGKLGALAKSLSEAMQRGKSLAEVVDESHYEFPRVYRAVVAAGVRSGRLAAALEGLSNLARRNAETRRAFMASMAYPFVLLFVATQTLAFMASRTVPVMARIYESLQFPLPWWYDQIVDYGAYVPFAIAAAWIAFFLVISGWVSWSRRPWFLESRGRWEFPTLRRMRYAERMATFAQVLALLIENHVPLDEAVALAAESSGDERFVQAGKSLAQQIRKGSSSRELSSDIPPLLQWLVTSGARGENLSRRLHHASDHYRTRAGRLGDGLSRYLPILAACCIGGSVTLAFCFVVLAPFYRLLQFMSLP